MTPSEPSGRFARPWQLWLAIAVFGFAIRLLMIFVAHPLCEFDADRWADPAQFVTAVGADSSCMQLVGDSAYLYGQGRMVSEGRGLSDPLWWLLHQTEVQSAKKPVGVVLVVAGLAKVGLTSPDASRVAMALLGSGTVFLVGRLAHRLFGRRAGIVACVLAATHPMLVTNDWRLLTESMAAFFFVLALGATYRMWERPTARTAVAVGVWMGCLWYARAESPLLWACTVPIVVMSLHQLSRSARARILALMAVSGIAVLSPMLVANSVRFNNPSPVGLGAGWGLMNSSCDVAWYYEYTGYLSGTCLDASTSLEVYDAAGHTLEGGIDESEADAVYRERAMRYVRENITRYPAVAAARIGRTLGFYSPSQTIELDTITEGRGAIDPLLAFAHYYAMIPLAALGLVIMRRRRMPISPMVGTLVSLVLLVAATFGLPRYRVFVDVVMLMLGGLALTAIPRLVRRQDWWTPPDGDAGPHPAVVSAMGRERPQRSRRWDRFGLAAVAAVTVIGTATVVWSAGVEPDRRIDGVSEQHRQELCNRLDRLKTLVEQINTNPQLLVQAPAELDAISALAPEAVKLDVAILKRQADALLDRPGSGGPGSITKEEEREGTRATARILEFRLASC